VRPYQLGRRAVLGDMSVAGGDIPADFLLDLLGHTLRERLGQRIPRDLRCIDAGRLDQVGIDRQADSLLPRLPIVEALAHGSSNLVTA
jgi:hypothetical protein